MSLITRIQPSSFLRNFNSFFKTYFLSHYHTHSHTHTHYNTLYLIYPHSALYLSTDLSIHPPCHLCLSLILYDLWALTLIYQRQRAAFSLNSTDPHTHTFAVDREKRDCVVCEKEREREKSVKHHLFIINERVSK